MTSIGGRVWVGGWGWRILWHERGGLIAYIAPSVLESRLSNLPTTDLFQTLQDTLPWRREVDDFGAQDRLSWYCGNDGADFAYVGLYLKPHPWTAELLMMRDAVNDCLSEPVAEALGLDKADCQITASLVNHYPRGDGLIPWHWDEVRAHGPAKMVCSVSLGGPRTFELKKRRGNGQEQEQQEEEEVGAEVEDGDDHDQVISTVLEPGSMMLMAGSAQDHWMHQLPNPDGDDAPARISLTMRSIVPGWEARLLQEAGEQAAKTGSCVE